MNATATTTPPARSTTGLLLMLVSTACFTTNVLLIRALGQLPGISIWTLAAVRFGVGLLVVSALFPRDLALSRIFRPGRLASRGLVGALGTCAFYLTIEHLGVGRATFISNSYVVLAALLAVPVLGETLRPTVLLGAVGALAGLALLTDAFGSGAQFGRYESVALLAAGAAAYVVVTIRQLHANTHTAAIFASQCIYGLLVCAGPAIVGFSRPVPLAAAGMLVAAIAATAGQLLMTRAFRDITVARGTLLQMLVPLGVAAGGLVFFQEHFLWSEAVGAALIVTGTCVSALRRA